MLSLMLNKVNIFYKEQQIK